MSTTKTTESMAKQPAQRTTISCSPKFAEMIGSLAGDAGVSVLEFCDEKVAPKFAKQYADLLRAKLAAVGG